MQSNGEVMFVATYDSGHEEWFWIDARELRGSDEMVKTIAKLRQRWRRARRSRSSASFLLHAVG